MTVLKSVLGIILLIIIAALVWNFFPGLRHEGKQAYRKYGGWTDEARSSDPVGFLEYAAEKLAQDLDSMQGTRRSLQSACDDLAARRTETEPLLEAADALAVQFRDAFQRAERDGFPVGVSGQSYKRAELIQQVQLILLQQEGYQQTLEQFTEATAAAEAKALELASQIAKSKAVLATLPAKIEIARVQELTASTTELLDQIHDVLGSNQSALGDTPIRTVEELMQTPAVSDPDGDKRQALEFLGVAP